MMLDKPSKKSPHILFKIKPLVILEIYYPLASTSKPSPRLPPIPSTSSAPHLTPSMLFDVTRLRQASLIPLQDLSNLSDNDLLSRTRKYRQSGTSPVSFTTSKQLTCKTVYLRKYSTLWKMNTWNKEGSVNDLIKWSTTEFWMTGVITAKCSMNSK